MTGGQRPGATFSPVKRKKKVPFKDAFEFKDWLLSLTNFLFEATGLEVISFLIINKGPNSLTDETLTVT